MAQDWSGINRSIDDIFNTYIQAKQMRQAQDERGRARSREDSLMRLQLAQGGIDPTGVNLEQPETISPAIVQALEAFKAKRQKESEATALSTREKELGLQKTQAEIAKLNREATGQQMTPLQWQMEKDRQTQARELQELQVPGYQLGTDIRPTQKEAQDIRTGTAALADFTKGVDRLQELIKKHGSTNIVGEGSGEMQTLAANLKLTLKEVQKLGVLSASDIAFLEAQVFDPSSIKSWGTKTGTALKQLETIKGRARSGLAESLRARGYSASGSTGKGGDPLGIR
jgi:hypothetical protein